MFKFAVSALLATVSADAKSDEAQLHKQLAGLKAGASKYGVTPGADIWSKTTAKDKVHHFMAGDATEYLTAAQDAKTDAKWTKISDLADGTLKQKFELAKGDLKIEHEAEPHNDAALCQLCVLTGNEYHPFTQAVTDFDKASKKYSVKTAAKAPSCAPYAADVAAAKKGKHPQTLTAADKPAMDYSLTYNDWLERINHCPQNAVCAADSYNAADFSDHEPKGRKAGWSWSYGWNSHAAAWDTCNYNFDLPHKWAGGLTLEHTLTADTQAVVSVTQGGANYIYNSFTLEHLSVGKTTKIVIPVADSIQITMTATEDQTEDSKFQLKFTRESNEALALFTLENGGVIVWVIIGIVVLCLVCVGVIVWKKCFHKENEFYLEDNYARV